MESLQLLTPPTGEPLTLARVKNHLRVEQDFEDDDELISSLITAARQHTEAVTSCLFLIQTWRLTLDRFPPCHDIEIRKRPVQQIVSIKYIDQDGVEQTVDPADYQVDSRGFLCRIRPAYNESWPSARCQMNAVTITFTAGYGDAQAQDDPDFDGSNYQVDVETDWVTAWGISAKTSTGFTITFGTVAPGGGGQLIYTVLGGEPVQRLLGPVTVDVSAAANHADIAFAQTVPEPSIIVGGIPEFMLSALLLLIGHYYENREETIAGVPIMSVPRGYDALVAAERVMRI